MAKLGCTTHGIMAKSGHKTMEMVELYTREFDREEASDHAYRKLIANSWRLTQLSNRAANPTKSAISTPRWDST
jgi:hypothetical protein